MNMIIGGKAVDWVTIGIAIALALSTFFGYLKDNRQDRELQRVESATVPIERPADK